MKTGRIIRRAPAAVVATVAVMLLASCDQTTMRRLDEATFYEGSRFTLKLVRYYENLPLHYSGEIFVVQCASAQTAASPGHQTQDAGWVQLNRGGAIGSKSAKEVAERERARYLVMDENTLVWPTNTVLNVSFNACGSIRRWDPTTLPAELIDPAEKPSYCAPTGNVDCHHYDFQGDRVPRFDDIQVSATGTISFTVRSKAFKSNQAFRVTSGDSGRSWTILPHAASASPVVVVNLSLAKPDDRIPAAVRGEFDDDDGRPLKAVAVDLDGDGLAEQFIPNEFLCGNGGCPWLIYSPSRGKVIGKLFGYSIEVTAGKNAGHKPLTVYSGLGAATKEVAHFEYTNGSYRRRD